MGSKYQNAKNEMTTKSASSSTKNHSNKYGHSYPLPDPQDFQCSNIGKDASDCEFKVMLLGDSCTGKTCLLIRFKDGTFLNNNFISTVGIDYRNKVVAANGLKVKLQIWDTAGQERFRSVTQAYYRDAHALLLLFDVTNPISFQNVRNWMTDVREYASDDVRVYLVGNKTDLSAQRKVKFEDAQKMAHNYKIPYIETSAKTGTNVQEIFMRIAQDLSEAKLGNKSKNGGDKVTLNEVDISRNWCYGYSCYKSS